MISITDNSEEPLKKRYLYSYGRRKENNWCTPGTLMFFKTWPLNCNVQANQVRKPTAHPYSGLCLQKDRKGTVFIISPTYTWQSERKMHELLGSLLRGAGAPEGRTTRRPIKEHDLKWNCGNWRSRVNQSNWFCHILERESNRPN